MKGTIQDRLLWRELGNRSRYSGVRNIYGDGTLVNDLDIVNELGGHSGCVNALSWSTSGRLLASGSDDQHLNVHKYQPETSTAPFTLDTTVATGHTANIFSVKFMPHSNDRTLVTAAGDFEVRVFDIEYSGRSSESSDAANRAEMLGGRHFRNLYKGVKYLSDGNTNARIYRSHADRVKRIVTESSPNLFLTCSEDGEVRQFDLRLPSSAYPPPSGGRGFLAHRIDHDNSNVPPPLISYKRYNLDLNTISCSASRPHYIALGGAHLHCFLHDRRMLGRDVEQERGTPSRASPAGSMSSAEEGLMGQATQCVRKFAPEGPKKMRRRENRHITACKISDANPNELIASWSGDHIYSFDIARSPNANDQRASSFNLPTAGASKSRARESGDRKRKRRKDASTTAFDAERQDPKPRTTPKSDLVDDMAIRVQYDDGQSEDLAMTDIAPSLPRETLQEARESLLTESQRRSLQIAKSLVKIRKLIFSLEASLHPTGGNTDLLPHRTSFTSALGFAASSYPEMKQISGSWRYPLNPVEEDIVLQQTLRANRNSAQRFVQAAGTLARNLGGRIQTASRTTSPALSLFRTILPLQPDGPTPSKCEAFSYPFLKAILLWLEGGVQALIEGFRRPIDQPKNTRGFPLPDNADESAINEILIPHLLQTAGDNAIPNVDASRFERDATRKIFESEGAAVVAFSNAIKMPLEDSETKSPTSSSEQEHSPHSLQDKTTALRFWGFKVGRGLLMNAGEGINFQFVDIAFGGLGNSQVEEDRSQEDIDPEDHDPVVEKARLIRQPGPDVDMTEGASNDALHRRTSPPELDERGSDDEVIRIDDLHDEIADRMAEEDANNEVHEDDENDDVDSEEGDDDEDITAAERSIIFQSTHHRSTLRERVEANVPCDSHTRTYRGHCNVKTVKDVNFFGLQDEYVVSGSDCGHLFIWDKKTSQLLNILQGDGEVVNVVQGHPYEPMLAVSGIDHTIKVFSPDARAQEDAKNGINISSATHGSHGYSSLSYTGRPRRSRNTETGDNETQAGEGLTSRKRMSQSYQITSKNDVDRQGGMRDAYITRGMLAQLAAQLRARQGGADAGGLGGGIVVGDDGVAIPVGDNCAIM